jgi:hypothetical protein
MIKIKKKTQKEVNTIEPPRDRYKHRPLAKMLVWLIFLVLALGYTVVWIIGQGNFYTLSK